MITITITQSGQTKTTVKENFIVKSTPTQFKEKTRYDEEKIACENEYAVVEVEKVENWSREILKQQIADETSFNLAAVIKAVNGL
jgi:hypothetical protein